MSALAKASGALKSVDYEVFGRVQGVCFRMYTEEEARKLGVVGWVKNTSQGTVTGQVQGPEDKVNAMKKKPLFLHMSTDLAFNSSELLLRNRLKNFLKCLFSLYLK
ncbi:acylphosphatase-2 isoform X1 [Grus americana]|uniref:acylphosphatase-2 isoform X1 n=1 Tax=Grus americana TaxID=9117 RepID=UPI00240788D0|nr:acylphosphatase-2 isoform X1 [Grus americana]